MKKDMPGTMIPLNVVQFEETKKYSPDYVRISAASAMALRLKSGRFSRDFKFGGINLLLNYEDGCKSDCGYCGLARTRPGNYEDQSFIRVDWPLYDTDTVIERVARYEENMTRLCISMVTHGSAYKDTLDITERIAKNVKTPLSLLVAPPTLNRSRLEILKEAGADMIGVGLDAVSERVFFDRRTNVPNGSLKWSNYWDIIEASRDIYGPWKVNIHTVVGLGETDKELVDIFYQLRDNEILAYLFSFNPEPDSRMGNYPRATITRWRRIQLVKHMIEKYDLKRDKIDFDDQGNMIKLKDNNFEIDHFLQTLDNGTPFETGGCPSADGEPGCTRPYGSYRPSESFRDFPFTPEDDDLKLIREELNMQDLFKG